MPETSASSGPYYLDPELYDAGSLAGDRSLAEGDVIAWTAWNA